MKPLPDIGGLGLRVLFCGINPSLVSAQVAHHFARPGNRFWRVLHLSGWTPRLLRPEEDVLLPQWGIGLTNLVDRATNTAAGLTRDEYRAGAAALERLTARWQPGVVAVVGIGAWRTAFGEPRATVGPQERRIGSRPAWAVPNPSGLNAHYQPAQMARIYAALKERARASAAPTDL